MRTSLLVTAAGLAACGLALVAAAGGATGLALLIGGIGIDLVIIGPFFVVRSHANRLRRFLPPWLPW